MARKITDYPKAVAALPKKTKKKITSSHKSAHKKRKK